MAIFIVIGTIVIQCVQQICIQVPYVPIKLLIAAGTLELIFEIAGAVRIYRNIRRKEK